MSNFETWWEREGQEFLYALNTTTDDDIKLVAEIAWKNGAYCAEQAEQIPVGYIYNDITSDRMPVYAAPQQREWVEPSDDEISKAFFDFMNDTPTNYEKRFARIIVALCKEKNRG